MQQTEFKPDDFDLEIPCFVVEHSNHKQFLTHVILAKGDAEQIPERLICLQCLASSSYADSACTLKTIREAPRQVLANTNFPDNQAQAVSKYIASHKYQINVEQINQEFEEIIDKLELAVRQVQKHVVANFEIFKAFRDQNESVFKKFDPIFDNRDFLQGLKNCNLHMAGKQRDQTQMEEAKKLAQIYTAKFHVPIETRLLEELEDVKRKQQLYYYDKKIQTSINGIKTQIKALEKTISENPFEKSRLANDNIITIFKRIGITEKEIDKRITLLFSTMTHTKELKAIMGQIEEIQKGAILFLASLENGQIIGAYIASFDKNKQKLMKKSEPALTSSTFQPPQNPIQPTSTQIPPKMFATNSGGQAPQLQQNLNNQQKDPVEPEQDINKSFLFSLTKNNIFDYKGKDAIGVPCEFNPIADLAGWIFRFGERDLVIKATLKSCTSELGVSFNTDGKGVGDASTYLGDGASLNIVEYEIFRIQ